MRMGHVFYESDYNKKSCVGGMIYQTGLIQKYAVSPSQNAFCDYRNKS